MVGSYLGLSDDVLRGEKAAPIPTKSLAISFFKASTKKPRKGSNHLNILETPSCLEMKGDGGLGSHTDLGMAAGFSSKLFESDETSSNQQRNSTQYQSLYNTSQAQLLFRSSCMFSKGRESAKSAEKLRVQAKFGFQAIA